MKTFFYGNVKGTYLSSGDRRGETILSGTDEKFVICPSGGEIFIGETKRQINAAALSACKQGAFIPINNETIPENIATVAFFPEEVVLECAGKDLQPEFENKAETVLPSCNISETLASLIYNNSYYGGEPLVVSVNENPGEFYSQIRGAVNGVLGILPKYLWTRISFSTKEIKTASDVVSVIFVKASLNNSEKFFDLSNGCHQYAVSTTIKQIVRFWTEDSEIKNGFGNVERTAEDWMIVKQIRSWEKHGFTESDGDLIYDLMMKSKDKVWKKYLKKVVSAPDAQSLLSKKLLLKLENGVQISSMNEFASFCNFASSILESSCPDALLATFEKAFDSLCSYHKAQKSVPEFASKALSFLKSSECNYLSVEYKRRKIAEIEADSVRHVEERMLSNPDISARTVLEALGQVASLPVSDNLKNDVMLERLVNSGYMICKDKKVFFKEIYKQKNGLVSAFDVQAVNRLFDGLTNEYARQLSVDYVESCGVQGCIKYCSENINGILSEKDSVSATYSLLKRTMKRYEDICEPAEFVKQFLELKNQIRSKDAAEMIYKEIFSEVFFGEYIEDLEKRVSTQCRTESGISEYLKIVKTYITVIPDEKAAVSIARKVFKSIPTNEVVMNVLSLTRNFDELKKFVPEQQLTNLIRLKGNAWFANANHEINDTLRNLKRSKYRDEEIQRADKKFAEIFRIAEIVSPEKIDRLSTGLSKSIADITNNQKGISEEGKRILAKYTVKLSGGETEPRETKPAGKKNTCQIYPLIIGALGVIFVAITIVLALMNFDKSKNETEFSEICQLYSAGQTVEAVNRLEKLAKKYKPAESLLKIMKEDTAFLPVTEAPTVAAIPMVTSAIETQTAEESIASTVPTSEDGAVVQMDREQASKAWMTSKKNSSSEEFKKVVAFYKSSLKKGELKIDSDSEREYVACEITDQILKDHPKANIKDISVYSKPVASAKTKSNIDYSLPLFFVKFISEGKTYCYVWGYDKEAMKYSVITEKEEDSYKIVENCNKDDRKFNEEEIKDIFSIAENEFAQTSAVTVDD